MKVDLRSDTSVEERFVSRYDHISGSQTSSDDETVVGEGSSKELVVAHDRMSSDPTGNLESEERLGQSQAVKLRRAQDLRVPKVPPAKREQFQVRQKWEGHVLEVLKGSFKARLYGIRSTFGQLGQQITEFEFEEIDEADRELIKPGAIFYWTIGYLHPGTQLISRIRFLRQPPLSNEEWDSIEQEVARLSTLIDD